MKLAQKIAINYLRARLNLIAVVSKKKAARKAFRLFCTPMRKSRKKPPPIFKQGEKLSITIDGLCIRGYRFNHPGSHRVLIAHGFESQVSYFDRYIAALIKKGYEVLAFDAPAHGRSDGKQITLPLYVKMLNTVLEHYGPADRFIGHSFGGLAIMHLLEKQQPQVPVRAVLLAPATESVRAIDSFFSFLDLHPAIRPEFDQLILAIAGLPASHYSITRTVPLVKAEICWFHDEADELTPITDVQQIREHQPAHVQFEISRGLGHYKILRNNNVVKKALEFL